MTKLLAMNRFIQISSVLFILFSLLALKGNAQDMGWKKHLKTADDFFSNAQYTNAAEHYKAAWLKKPKKKEFIYKAGEAYAVIKDYKNAAEAFKNVKDDFKEFPLAGLKYARALKQSGDYDSASRELVYFLNNYQGSDKSVISQVVQNEIRGCELGIKLSATSNTDVEIRHLNSNINTPETEFAPYGFDDNTIYYSSTMAAHAEIYRSRKINGEWTKPERPSNFPKIEGEHFCNGNLTPDGQRYYFTICESKESWGGLTTECDLYVIKNKGEKWSKPERLRDYVNLEGFTSTHPYTVHQGNTEILYFASNREGGKGGMDIWYMTRDLKTDDIDFSFPINCGSKINTPSDEITPYYDTKIGDLYFSSNGHTSIGGYDIFHASGAKSGWETPKNLGIPFNSSADDFFFVRMPSRNGGFLVSNRLFGAEKISTTDEDIFAFSDKNAVPTINIQGEIVDSKTNQVLNNVMVSLSQYKEGGLKQFMANRRFEDGKYSFEVLSGAEYEIEAQRNGYLPKSYVFSARDIAANPIEKVLAMERTWKNESVAVTTPTPSIEKPIVTTTPITNTTEKEETPAIVKEDMPMVKEETKIETPPSIVTTTPETPVETVAEEVANVESVNTVTETTPTTSTYIEPTTTTIETTPVSTPVATTYPSSTTVSIPTYSNTIRTSNGITTSAPVHNGTYYKIQLIAVTYHDPNASHYNAIQGLGRLDTELIEAKGITRVLLSDFFSYSEAKNILSDVRQKRRFERAYIVKYRDGERVGRVN